MDVNENPLKIQHASLWRSLEELTGAEAFQESL